jgi:hypothetical protein
MTAKDLPAPAPPAASPSAGPKPIRTPSRSDAPKNGAPSSSAALHCASKIPVALSTMASSERGKEPVRPLRGALKLSRRLRGSIKADVPVHHLIQTVKGLDACSCTRTKGLAGDPVVQQPRKRLR